MSLSFKMGSLGWALLQYDWCHEKGEGNLDTGAQGERRTMSGGRGQGDVPTSQGGRRLPASPQKFGKEGGVVSPLQPLERVNPGGPSFQSSGLQNYERLNCCHLSHPVCGAGLPWWLRWLNNLPEIRETWVRSLGCKDPLKEGMTSHSSTLA